VSATAGAPVPRGAAALEGPAFPPLVKLLAGALMAALLIAGLRALEPLWAQRPGWPLLLVMAGLSGVVAVCFWWILVSRTTVTATHIRQTWWRDKEVAIAEITQTKLILVPGLTWLIAPRLVVRTRAPGSIVFHAAEPRLITAFARLSLGQPALP
jgi:hypothetical protein